MRSALLTTLLTCALGLVFTTARAQEKPDPKTQKIVRNGVEIEFNVEPVQRGASLMAGEDAVFRFRIRDTPPKLR